MKRHHQKYHSPRTHMAPPPKTAAVSDGIVEGIADDFNNILTTVMGACSLIDKEAAVNSELLQYVNIIRTSAERAASLSDRLVKREAAHNDGDMSNQSPVESGDPDSTRDKATENTVLSPPNSSQGTPK